ncbi:MAG: HhH-GPD-type base excision DNA repair protein [Candidatus Nanopelagicales bacterium]
MRRLQIAQEPGADGLLSRDPFALLVGMLLDQQFPMERAFAGPAVIAQRIGTPDRLDPAMIASYDPHEFTALMTGPPAVHRFPGSMGGRVQALARVVADAYGGDAEAIWRDVPDGPSLLTRLKRLPGFGDQKARIFLALLGKQLSVRPPGWEAAAGAYAVEGTRRSVADVVDAQTLAEVRAFKQEAKAAAKAP